MKCLPWLTPSLHHPLWPINHTPEDCFIFPRYPTKPISGLPLLKEASSLPHSWFWSSTPLCPPFGFPPFGLHSAPYYQMICGEMRSNEMGRATLMFSAFSPFLRLILAMAFVLRVSANGEGLWFRYFFPIFSFILSARTCSFESYLVKIDGLYRLCWNNYLSKGSLWNCWFNMKKLCNWVISTWMFPICLWDLNRWCPKCLQVEFGWPQQCLAKLEYHSYESLHMVSCYMWWKRKCYTCVSLIRPTIFCFSN